MTVEIQIAIASLVSKESLQHEETSPQGSGKHLKKFGSSLQRIDRTANMAAKDILATLSWSELIPKIPSMVAILYRSAVNERNPQQHLP